MAATTRLWFRLILYIGIPLIVATLTLASLRRVFLEPLDKTNTEVKIVEIAPKTSFKQITKLLNEKNLIRAPWALELIARLRKVDTNIPAGEYELRASMTLDEILAKLIKGEIVKRRFTVVEGMTIWDIGKLVEGAGLVTKAEWDAAVIDKSLLIRAGINADSFEGYLFPDTYQFSRPITVKDIIWSMLEEGEKRWSGEFANRADELQLSRHEILSLASIIEKESGRVEEQPKISSVFHNRINQGMKLQADPTVIYGIKNFNGNLTRTDLETDHPWNTYTRPGLPIGPICNPGVTAVKAALFPEVTPYLFFVADGMGSHIFSTTLQEHNEAVNRYQRGGGAPPPSAPPVVPIPPAPTK